MKVQSKLVYLNTLLFTAVFIVVGFLFIITYTHYAIFSIQRHLKNSTNICAMFHLEEDELSPGDFAQVRDQYEQSVSNIYYQVYGEDNTLRYGLGLDSVPNDVLDTIRRQKKYFFSDDKYYTYGLFYRDNEGDFVVVTKEKKEILQTQQKMLATLLFLGMVLSGVLVFFISKFIAYKAFKPFRDINKAASELIQNKKETLQLIDPKSKDELSELIMILNKLLKQLEENSVIQKNFVRYVTHEFKTPIAVIKGNLEVFLIKDRTSKEYKLLADKLIKEVDGLTQIINTLLAISNIDNNENIQISLTKFSIDALIDKIVDHIQMNHSNCIIDFQNKRRTENEQKVMVVGDRTQINMVLFNLIENAVKYSKGKPVSILLDTTENQTKLIIKDAGIGIPKEQIKLISQPFYRADNASSKSGSGIGLSIALKILEKNKIKYNIESVLNQGTTITILF